MYKKKLEEIFNELGYDTVLSIPKNSDHGDYTTNIALQLAKQLGGNGKQPASPSAKRGESPEQIAKEILKKIGKQDFIEKINIVNGFINFFINPKSLMQSLHNVCDYSSLVNPEKEVEGQAKRKVLVEFAHPNTHKAFHIGHTRNIILGESICRLLETSGSEVFRANYQGDIGLHVAKALWGIKKLDSRERLDVEFLGKAYAKGAVAYEEDEKVREEIQEINKQLYARDPKIVSLWQKTRKISLDYFNTIYQKMGTKFDHLFFESEVEVLGKKIVEENIGKVFTEDQGAVIFKGEDYGLHNRVFITAVGNPTYEAKDMGLGYLERETYPFDLAIHIVAEDQAGYFQVMFQALILLDDWFVGKEKHLSYGMVNLPSGKMASRTGNVVTFDWLFSEVKRKVADVMRQSPTSKDIKDEEKEQIIDIVSIGAIKFAMLKYSPQTNITFDLEKSVSLQGDSGPYVQYTYARAKSVLRSAQYDYQPTEIKGLLEPEERELLRKIEHFDSVIEDAAVNYAPNIVANYLLDFAKAFNLFYQKHPIIKGNKIELRLALTCAVAVVLKQGLNLLGIEAPERM